MRANRTIAVAPGVVAMLAALIVGAARAEDVPASVDTTIIGGESSIVLNPANASNLVVGSNDNERHGCNVSRSIDRGQTWAAGGVNGKLPGADQLPSSVRLLNASDPSLAADRAGRIYYSCIFFQLGRPSSEWLVVSRSDDGGATWDPVPAVLGSPADQFRDDPSLVATNDKPYLTVDTTGGSHDGAAYLSWTRFTCESPDCAHPIWLRRSTDRGDSWVPPVHVSDDGNGQGSVPAIGPNGEVYVAWAGYTSTDSDVPNRIMVDHSLDGGATFGTDRMVASIAGAGQRDICGNSFPTMAVDRSSGPNHGSVYVAFIEAPAGQPCRVMLSASRDGGDTWSAPIAVTDPPASGHDQALPWMTVDPRGRVDIVFLDGHTDPTSSQIVDAYETWSVDGARSFNTSRLLTESPNPFDFASFDYIGAAVDAKSFFSAWPFADPLANPLIDSDHAPVRVSELRKALTRGTGRVNGVTHTVKLKSKFVLSRGTSIAPTTEGLGVDISLADGSASLWHGALPANCPTGPCLMQIGGRRLFRFVSDSDQYDGMRKVVLSSGDGETWRLSVEANLTISLGNVPANATVATTVTIGNDAFTDATPARTFSTTAGDLIVWKWTLPRRP